MNETTTTLETIAREAYDWLETARRATGDTETGPREDGEEYVRIRDGAPDWVTDLVYTAHGSDFLPDDWKYAAIRSAVGSIADGYDEDEGPHEWADSEVDIYTGARYAWIASNLNRQSYIDDAITELGMEPTGDVAEMIGWGQYMEAREIFESVVSSLTAEIEAREGVA